MLKSMTAFGRASVTSPLARLVVEIHSVNRKHLEINTFIPRELSRFDPDIKNWVSEQIARGYVTIRITVTYEKESPVMVSPNIPLARQIKDAWDKITTALNLPEKDRFSLAMLAKEQGVLLYDEEIADEDVWREALKKAVEEALEPLLKMKKKEGIALQTDISQRLQLMSRAKDVIAQLSPGATERFRQKLMERLEEVLPGKFENEERILREVCVYAEKIDISEELTRFDSHLKQFEDLIKSEQTSIGKTLEFLVQELNREVNTMGSKSSEVEVTKKVIEIKSELEKIREQIQNVE